MKFYLNYNLGDSSFKKVFTSMYELEIFLNKLCEIKQTSTISLDSCSYELEEKMREKK
jgi:hypothetical protein